MVSQATGLAQAIGFPYIHQQVRMHWPFSSLWPGLLPPWNGVFRDRELIAPDDPPRVVVSCGRQGSAASIALKRRFRDRVFTVHIQDPKLPARLFDLIVTPAHDGLIGPNVIHSFGAVHHISRARLQEARDHGPTAEMAGLGPQFIGVVLGGPNRYYGFTDDDITRLIDQLDRLTTRTGVQLAIVPSRRTPPAAVSRLADRFESRHFVWRGQGANPYLTVLALASHLVVTGDSVSMVSEAAATCRPVYVYHLAERRRARRFRTFHESFVRAGITRPFAGELANWTYASPDRTGLIATLIQEHLR